LCREQFAHDALKESPKFLLVTIWHCKLLQT